MPSYCENLCTFDTDDSEMSTNETFEELERSLTSLLTDTDGSFNDIRETDSPKSVLAIKSASPSTKQRKPLKRTNVALGPSKQEDSIDYCSNSKRALFEKNNSPISTIPRDVELCSESRNNEGCNSMENRSDAASILCYGGNYGTESKSVNSTPCIYEIRDNKHSENLETNKLLNIGGDREICGDDGKAGDAGVCLNQETIDLESKDGLSLQLSHGSKTSLSKESSNVQTSVMIEACEISENSKKIEVTSRLTGISEKCSDNFVMNHVNWCPLPVDDRALSEPPNSNFPCAIDPCQTTGESPTGDVQKFYPSVISEPCQDSVLYINADHSFDELENCPCSPIKSISSHSTPSDTRKRRSLSITEDVPKSPRSKACPETHNSDAVISSHVTVCEKCDGSGDACSCRESILIAYNNLPSAKTTLPHLVGVKCFTPSKVRKENNNFATPVNCNTAVSMSKTLVSSTPLVSKGNEREKEIQFCELSGIGTGLFNDDNATSVIEDDAAQYDKLQELSFSCWLDNHVETNRLNLSSGYDIISSYSTTDIPEGEDEDIDEELEATLLEFNIEMMREISGSVYYKPGVNRDIDNSPNKDDIVTENNVETTECNLKRVDSQSAMDETIAIIDSFYKDDDSLSVPTDNLAGIIGMGKLTSDVCNPDVNESDSSQDLELVDEMVSCDVNIGTIVIDSNDELSSSQKLVKNESQVAVDVSKCKLSSGLVKETAVVETKSRAQDLPINKAEDANIVNVKPIDCLETESFSQAAREFYESDSSQDLELVDEMVSCDVNIGTIVIDSNDELCSSQKLVKNESKEAVVDVSKCKLFGFVKETAVTKSKAQDLPINKAEGANIVDVKPIDCLETEFQSQATQAVYKSELVEVSSGDKRVGPVVIDPEDKLQSNQKLMKNVTEETIVHISNKLPSGVIGKTVVITKSETTNLPLKKAECAKIANVKHIDCPKTEEIKSNLQVNHTINNVADKSKVEHFEKSVQSDIKMDKIDASVPSIQTSHLEHIKEILRQETVSSNQMTSGRKRPALRRSFSGLKPDMASIEPQTSERKILIKVADQPKVSFPDENKDIEHPAWDSMKKLSTDDERYKLVRSRWQLDTVPDPNRDLTFHSFRRRRVLNEMKMERSAKNPPPNISRKRTATVTANISNVPSKRTRTRTVPCTHIIDSKIDSMKKEFNNFSRNARNEFQAEIRRLSQQQQKIRNNSHWSQYNDYPEQYYNYPFYDSYVNAMSSSTYNMMLIQNESETNRLHFEHETKVTEARKKYDVQLNRLLCAREEINKFCSFYKGLSGMGEGNDPTVLTENQMKELMEIENVYNAFEKNYRRQD